jgi:hypothetical protein
MLQALMPIDPLDPHILVWSVCSVPLCTYERCESKNHSGLVDKHAYVGVLFPVAFVSGPTGLQKHEHADSLTSTVCSSHSSPVLYVRYSHVRINRVKNMTNRQHGRRTDRAAVTTKKTCKAGVQDMPTYCTVWLQAQYVQYCRK